MNWALLVLLPLASQNVSLPDLDAEVRRARNEYAYGDYEQAITRLHDLLYPMRLTTDNQVIQARKTLALAYYLTGQSDLAQEEFTKLLYLDPDYELDPYVVAPPIIELFEATRRKMKPELDAIRQRKSDDQMQHPGREGYVRIVETTITERSDIATFLPFGVGQFQNGQIGWGVFFALTELALLAVNIGSYLWGWSIGDYLPTDHDTRRLAQGLLVAQYASATLFGVVWSVGVLHARIHFKPYETGPQTIREEPIGDKAIPPAGVSLKLTF